jgi:hypothetical protein
VADRTLLLGVNLLATGLRVLRQNRRGESDTQDDYTVRDLNHDLSFIIMPTTAGRGCAISHTARWVVARSV